MKKSMLVTLLLILVVALVIGCSSTAMSSVGTTAQAKASTQASTSAQPKGPSSDNPIKIGVLAMLTGDFATLGKTCYVSMQIAQDEINAAGGVLGRKVEFVTLDTAGNPTQCVELARQLIENKEICAVLGPIRGAVEGFTACPVTNEAKLVTLLPVCSVSNFCAMGEYVFSMAGRQDYEMPHLAKSVLTDILSSKKVAIIYKNNEWGVSSVDALTKSCEGLGIKIVGLEPYAENETDFTTVLTKLRQSKPDSIVLVSEAVDGASILTQMQQLGWNDVNKIGVGATYSAQTLSFAAKNAANGLITTTAYFISKDDPKGYAYAQEFEKRTGYAPTVHGPLSYDSVIMLCEAIKKAGSIDRTAIKDGLFAIKDIKGIAGSYTFTDVGDIKRDYMVIQVKDNKFERYQK